MAKSANDLLVVIDATTEQLRRELKRADDQVAQSTQKIDRSLDRIDRSFRHLNREASTAAIGIGKSIGVIAVAAAGLAAVQGIRTTTQDIIELQLKARGLGVAAEDLQELGFVFTRLHIPSDQLAESLTQLSAQAVGALSGSKSLVDAWAELGVSVDDLRGKNPVELFGILADGIQNTESATTRLGVASTLLGDDLAARLLPSLAGGSEGLDKLKQKAHELGIVLDNEVAKNASDTLKNFSDLGSLLSGNFKNAVANVLADLEPLSEMLKKLAERAQAVFDAIGGIYNLAINLAINPVSTVGDFIAGQLGLHKPVQPESTPIPIRGGRDAPAFEFFPLPPEAPEAAEKVKTQLEEANHQMGQLKLVSDQVGFTMSSAFERAVLAGESLRGVLQGLVQDLQQILLRQLVTKPAGNFLSGLIQGAIGGIAGAVGGASAGLTSTTGSLSSSLNAAIPSTFAGLQARAGGGPVMAGQPYLVGERGPELFISRVPGTILPNGVTNNLGGTTVNQTNHITVSGGTASEIARLREEIQSASAQAAKAGAEGGRALVINDMMRDGPASRAMRR